MRKAALLSSVLILAMGCVPPTANIESNLRSGYTKQHSSIYIIGNTEIEASRPFFKELLDKLKTRLSERSINCKVHLIDPLSLSTKSCITAGIDEIHASAILTITQTELLNAGNGFGCGSFNLHLTEPGENAPVWKAVLETKTGATTLVIQGPFHTKVARDIKTGDPDITASNIIDKLTSDHLIANTK